MFGNLSGPTMLVILFIVLLMFGAPKLPGLAKSIGQSMKILKKEVRGSADGDQPADTAAGTDSPVNPSAQPGGDKPAAQPTQKPTSANGDSAEADTDKQ